jgi:threonine/homoserine/homoserine lactone efflux protein
VIALIFAIVAFPSVALWALFGRTLTHALRSPFALRIFNYTMAALLVGSLAFLSFH